jgi:uncharacterized protein YgiM (DUF1202 family)
MSKGNKRERKEVENPVEEIVVEAELPEETQEVDELEITEEQPKEETVSVGFVDNCDRLNVRTQPDKNAQVLTIIVRNMAVQVNIEDSTDLFYKVKTQSGLTGFCVKEYITIKQ